MEPPDLALLATNAMPRRGLDRKADGTPTKKTERNHRFTACGYTDPESHLMPSGGSFLQGYNCQLTVDRAHQVIVAVGVSIQSPDFEHLEPMLERITTNACILPDVMTMDAGYWSEKMSTSAQIRELTLISPPAGSRMARKLRSKKGSRIYAQRKAIVEKVNGQFKEYRGLRRFLLQGLGKVNGEWHLIAATHNLL